MKPIVLLFLFATLLLSPCILSCTKGSETENEDTFIGKWSFYNHRDTSSGNIRDTITFLKQNGQYFMKYGRLNPGFALPDEVRFSYQKNKLRLKDDVPFSDNFRRVETFSWIIKGRSFEVQGADIYKFMSSTSTYFTFIKII